MSCVLMTIENANALYVYFLFLDESFARDKNSAKGTSNTAASAFALSAEGVTCPFSIR